MNPCAIPTGLSARFGGVAALALAFLGPLAVVAATPARAADAAAPAASAPVRLSWSLARNVFPPEVPQARARAVFTLTNLGTQPLPAQGWALYFTCLSGVVTGPVGAAVGDAAGGAAGGVAVDAAAGPLLIEQMAGTWYRLRPAAGMAPVAPGQSVRLAYEQPEPLVKLDKAPRGPYLVLDSAPGQGLAIADYTIEPLTRPEQLAKAAGDASPVPSADDRYRRHAAVLDVPEAALAPVFPTPLQHTPLPGTLRWTHLPTVQAPPALRQERALARALLAPYLGSGRPPAAQPPLRLAIGRIPGQASPEAYTLVVDARDGVTITGHSAAGVSRGLQSLRALMPLQPQPGQGVALAGRRLTDAPRFAYRGLLMDVARNFQPKEVVFRVLDLMARTKLNALHLHLTDDEGWRLAIPGLPELTDVGARRGHTLDGLAHLPPAYGSGPDVRDPHGSGHYSASDYIAILRHAARLQIEVIPEIEMPGHARAAVKAMASRAHRLALAGRTGEAQRYRLDDPADASRYRSAQLYTDHLMDPGLESTDAFIAQVVDELARLHRRAGVPLRRLHVGADELPAGAWEKSPATAALMQRHGLASTAEAWNHFYDRVDAILRRHGIAAAGWEELGARRAAGNGALEPNPHFTGRGLRLYVWNNIDGAEDLAYRLANAGYDTILAPATNLYFDMAHDAGPLEPGVHWAAYTDLDAVFDYVPLDAIRRAPTDATPLPGRQPLSAAGRQRILGLEGTLFSETVRDVERLDYLLLPRLLALAERAWAADPAWARESDPARAQALHAADWSAFVHQIGRRVLPRLDAEGTGLRYRIPPPGLRLQAGRVLANPPLPGFALHYTTDGTEPTAASRAVVDGVITERGLIRVAAVSRSGRAGRSLLVDNR